MHALIHWTPVIALGGAVLCALKALHEFPLGLGAKGAALLSLVAILVAALLGRNAPISFAHCLEFFALMVVIWIPLRLGQP